jgi:O-antigen/teichoic acid export membrane protein
MSIASKVFSIFQRDALIFIANLLTGVVIARTLGPNILGVWVILTMILAYAEVLGRSKSDLASVYYIGKKIFRQNDIFLNLNFIAFVSSLLIIILILWNFELIYGWMFVNEIKNYREELKILLFIIPLQFFYLNYSYYYNAIEDFYAYNRLAVIQTYVSSIIGISLLLATSLNIWSIILAKLFGTGCAIAYGWYLKKQRMQDRGVFRIEIIKALLVYGKNFYITGILGQLQQSGIRLLSVLYLMPAQIAFLSQGQVIISMLNKIVDPVSTIIYPHISRSRVDDVIEVSCKAFRVSFILMSAIGLMLFVVVESLITLLYGEAFHSSAIVAKVLLPGVIISGVASVLGNYFKGVGAAHVFLYLMPGPLVFQIFMAWLFLPLWGVNGAAMAVSIGQAIYGLVIIIYFIQYTRIPVYKLVPNLSDFKVIYGFVFSKMKS